ncbi:MAG: proline--tRNA ligase [Alphaproteobacteria bacterium]|nr:proline--tRNA ligase [Alphaproteobacteria bacterium]
MRLSQYFLPLLKETPSEAQIASHRLMLRAGMIRQTAAGIYTWLPLGFRVLQKVEQIVREEQDAAGALELLMPTLQPAELWRESGRYEDYGEEMLRLKDRHEREMLYGPTNEELITEIFRQAVRSYRDLPKNLYHIQWKFRDEVRPRFGVMRGREFLMKDNYSFDVDKAASLVSYFRMFKAYMKTFKRMGLTPIPVRAATGPIGGDLSHEFHVQADTGESQLYFDSEIETLDENKLDPASPTVQDELLKWYAATDEKHDPAAFARVPEARRREARGIEVGQLFYFGTKYSAPMKATVAGPKGDTVAVEMGSYGIGVSRLVGAIIEAFHDEVGIIWPESVAPFRVGLVNLRPGDKECAEAGEQLYQRLMKAGIDTLYDEREESPGAKFAAMDLIGLPWQVVVGPRGLKQGVVEIKERKTGAKQELSPDAAVARLVGLR